MIKMSKLHQYVPEAWEPYFKSVVFAFVAGVNLYICAAVISIIPIAPWFTGILDEMAAIAFMALIYIFSTSRINMAAAMVCFALGYWMLPNITHSAVALATNDEITGTLQKSYLDEAKGGKETRRIFIIRDHATCETSQYVSKDELVLVFGIWPLVYHTTSQKTRDQLLTLEGQSVSIKDIHDRRGTRDMPLLGAVGGWVTGLFGADWTSFPNIYSVEASDASDPCR